MPSKPFKVRVYLQRNETVSVEMIVQASSRVEAEGIAQREANGALSAGTLEVPPPGDWTVDEEGIQAYDAEAEEG